MSNKQGNKIKTYGPYGDTQWEFYQERLEMLAMIEATCEDCRNRDTGNYAEPFKKSDCWECQIGADLEKWSRPANTKETPMPKYEYTDAEWE